ncbi:RHS repeat domain-containing protein, partial [Dyella tabacisoli]
MVAVIAGNGLGLGNTSLTQLGQASGGAAPLGQGRVGQYLNIASGNLILQNADEGLVFDGLPLNVLRTYNSLGQLSGNQGWQFGFNRTISGLAGTLNTAGSTVSRIADDGSAVTYAYNATLGKYVSSGQSGSTDTLAWSAGASTWTWTDGASRQQEVYNATGQLTQFSTLETGASYSFTYTGSQLHTIVAGDGDTLTLGYDTSGRLSSLSISEVPPGQTTAVTRQQLTYTYDTQSRLSTVTTTLASDTNSASTASYATTYTYDGSSDRVASVTQSDGTTVSYTYAADANGVYRVATITTGSGAAAQTLTLGYTLGTDTTTVTDGLGRTWTYTYNPAGELTQVVAPAVNGVSATTHYSYDSNGNLTQVIDANGGITTYTYDANGNRLSVEDATGHTANMTYNADNQVVSRTIYTVPAQGVLGQGGYVPPGGAQTTYYVYDSSDRLRFAIDATGAVSESQYNGAGLLAMTRTFAGATYGVGTLSPTHLPDLATVTSWTTTQDLTRTTRVDYNYDVRGQLSSRSAWDTVDATGAGVSTGVGSFGAAMTTYSYDAQGRLLQQVTLRGFDRATLNTTSFTYDGLGRLLSTTDPLGNVTTYVYTDSGNTLAVTQANGL